MPHCPRGTRRNKTTGNCEARTATTTTATGRRKRCANGTRRNKTTGNCEAVASPSAARARRVVRSTTSRYTTTATPRDAVFYDIANEVTSGYPIKQQAIGPRIAAYLKQHPQIQYGDILFLGSSYGFCLVLEGGLVQRGKDPLRLALSPRVLPELQRRRIHYDALLRKMNKTSVRTLYREKGIL